VAALVGKHATPIVKERTVTVYYKVLDEHRRSVHGGDHEWGAPRGGPGKWTPLIENIEPCKRGYHLVTKEQLPHWLGPTIWIAEGRGEHVAQDIKHVFGQARLLRRVPGWDLTVCKKITLQIDRELATLRNDTQFLAFADLTEQFLDGKISQEEYSSCSYYHDYSSYYSSYSYSYYYYYSYSYYYSRYAELLTERLGLE
jgi:hypothetical protein